MLFLYQGQYFASNTTRSSTVMLFRSDNDPNDRPINHSLVIFFYLLLTTADNISHWWPTTNHRHVTTSRKPHNVKPTKQTRYLLFPRFYLPKLKGIWLSSLLDVCIWTHYLLAGIFMFWQQLIKFAQNENSGLGLCSCEYDGLCVYVNLFYVRFIAFSQLH